MQVLKGDVQRLAMRASGLLIVSHTRDGEGIRDASVQQVGGYQGVFLCDAEFDSPEKVGEEPVHADHVVVGQGRFDVCRFEHALGPAGLPGGL